MPAKVFCVGFHKTGTTSLARALQTLGYRITGPNGQKDRKIEKNVLAMIDELVPQFDTFQDNPWPILYKYLDKKYPGSKFILTIREPESWIKSQVRHFGRRKTPMRKWIYGYGSPMGNEEVYLKRYNSHNAEVLDYFKDRPDDLLVMNLATGDGWEKLCHFLGKPLPNRPFPHVNRASEREKAHMPVRRLRRKVQKIVNLVLPN